MRTPSTPVKMHVSTDTKKPLQRTAFWSDFVCSKLVEAECTLGTERLFRGNIERLQLPDMGISHIAADAQRVVRTKLHLARARDEQFVVMLQRAGQSALRCRCIDVACASGCVPPGSGGWGPARQPVE
ncbi:MAG: hypothetical protein H7172_01225 [Ferruginibacter sp.]|nr:hypothetical protein [Rhodoferax sp.]